MKNREELTEQTDTQLLPPLAMRMRPVTLDQFIGQSHLIAQGKPLYSAIQNGSLHSMILWGPPGTGKTTLAQLMASMAKACFHKLSAVFSGVKEIREIVQDAKKTKQEQQQRTILFMDEIHRFNKAQQDLFLPFVEDGTFILIGATTENPSFELNRALLSRMRVYVLHSLKEEELFKLLQCALEDNTRGLGHLQLVFPEKLRHLLIQAADGDARQILNLLDVIASELESKPGEKIITEELLADVLQTKTRRFDKRGDLFYDQISALHKAVRGSSPDAALYWLACMLEGGCDPRYVARRMIRMASEDIGLADPRALELALNAAETYERLGSPEGELAIAQAIIYLACAAKSNAVYTAWQTVREDARLHGSLEVPLHLRNAPTSLMKALDYGKGYRYAHDEKEAYAAGENYFPEQLKNRIYYHPTSRGLEAKIIERLAYLRGLDKGKKT